MFNTEYLNNRIIFIHENIVENTNASRNKYEMYYYQISIINKNINKLDSVILSIKHQYCANRVYFQIINTIISQYNCIKCKMRK